MSSWFAAATARRRPFEIRLATEVSRSGYQSGINERACAAGNTASPFPARVDRLSSEVMRPHLGVGQRSFCWLRA